jgi:hypothetical protein
VAVDSVANLLVLQGAARFVIESELSEQPAGAGLGTVANLDAGMLAKFAESVGYHHTVLVQALLGLMSAVQGLHGELQELKFVAREAPRGIQLGPNLARVGSNGVWSSRGAFLIAQNFSPDSTSDIARRPGSGHRELRFLENGSPLPHRLYPCVTA